MVSWGDALRSGVPPKRRGDGWRRLHGGRTQPHRAGTRLARARLGAPACRRRGRARRHPRSRRRWSAAAPARSSGRRSGRRPLTPRAQSARSHRARNGRVRIQECLPLAPRSEPVLPGPVQLYRQLLPARVPPGDRQEGVRAVRGARRIGRSGRGRQFQLPHVEHLPHSGADGRGGGGGRRCEPRGRPPRRDGRDRGDREQHARRGRRAHRRVLGARRSGRSARPSIATSTPQSCGAGCRIRRSRPTRGNWRRTTCKPGNSRPGNGATTSS